MSFHLTKLAMNADFQDDPVAKNVMIALCWSFFDGAPHALMNQERICRRTGYKRRAVQLAIARLKRPSEEKGASDAPFLRTEKIPIEDRAYGLINVDYFGVGAGNSPKYTINVPTLEAMQFPEQLSLRLTSLRAVEPDQKGAPHAPFVENQQNQAKGASDAPFLPEKGARDQKKGAPHAPYHENVILPYTTTHTDNGKTLDPNGVGVWREEPSEKTRSRFSIKQWFAYAKTQPSIKNPMAFASTRCQTTEHDAVLELHLEIQRQNKAAAHNAPDDCLACRGTGWELVAGKGVRPCGCRPQQGVAKAQ